MSESPYQAAVRQLIETQGQLIDANCEIFRLRQLAFEHGIPTKDLFPKDE
jgi:hypothetical protein